MTNAYPFLSFFFLWMATANLSAQTPDTTYLNSGTVVLIVDGGDSTFYYRVSTHYPAMGREAGIEGTMTARYTLDGGCAVRNVTFESSLGEDFERSIHAMLNKKAKMIRFYEPRKCGSGPYRETLTFDLGL